MDVPAPFSFAFWVGPAQAVGSAAALYIFCLQVLEGAVAATPVLVAAYLLWADPVGGLFPLPAMSASFFSTVASVLNHLFDVFVDCSHLRTYASMVKHFLFNCVCVSVVLCKSTLDGYQGPHEGVCVSMPHSDGRSSCHGP